MKGNNNDSDRNVDTIFNEVDIEEIFDEPDFTSILGRNIKDIRINSKPEKYTVKYMVSEINKLLPDELNITEGLYYKWESSDRMPTARQIPAIAKALGVTETSLFHWHERKSGVDRVYYEDFCETLRALDKDRYEKLAWIILNWSTNFDALVEFNILFESLSEEDRKLAITLAIKLSEGARRSGKTGNNCPRPDINLLENYFTKK